jgi:hypothetical protein
MMNRCFKKTDIKRLVAPLANQSGYTMFLVLELIIIVMVFFSISLHESFYVRTQAVREIHAVQAKALAESGITKIEYFLNGNEGRTILWESGNEVDSLPFYGTIHYRNNRFGLFSKLESSGTCIRTTCSVLAVAGRTMPDNCTPVLTLHGKVGSLALMEGSSIKGTVILSHGRVCKGNTTQEVRESGLTVKIQDAQTMPFDSSQAIAAIKRFSNEFAAACSTKSSLVSGLTLGAASSKDTLLSRDTIIVSGDCRVESGSHTNKTIIASGTITVLSEAKCLLCTFSAKNIRVEGGSTDRCVFYSRKKLVIAGGTHNSQFFGEDSIMVGQTASYGQMSMFMLYRQGKADSCSSIFVGPKTILNGTIICCSDTIARRVSRLPSVIFGKDCSLEGLCLSDGDADMNGITVKGHLWLRSIVTTDNKHGYVNFLFNARLEAGDKPYVFPLVGKTPATIFVDRVATSVTVRKHVPRKEPVGDTAMVTQNRSGI